MNTDMERRCGAIALAIYLLLVGSLSGDELSVVKWPQFRGVNSSGVAESGQPPVEFGPDKNVLWSIDLPSGHSSPCVWNEHVFLTSFEPVSRKLELWCIDRSSGATRWKKAVPAKRIEKGHPAFNPASSTPATDGTRVVAYFGSYGLICLDYEGNQLWSVPLPVAETFAGNATSPMIVGDQVLLYRATYKKHYLVAVTLNSGKEMWRHEFTSRFGPADSCTSTPVIWDDMVVLHCLDGVSAHSLHDGKPVWWASATTTATSSPVFGDDHLFVATWHHLGESELLPEYPEFDPVREKNDRNKDGRLSPDEFPKNLTTMHRPHSGDAPYTSRPVHFGMVDRDGSGFVERHEWKGLQQFGRDRRAKIREHGLLAIRLGGKGDVTETHVRVMETQSIPEVPSPIFYDGRVYIVKNGGILTCLDCANGKRLYRKRVGGSGTHYASPIVNRGKLYLSSGEGRITVIDVTGKTPRVLAKNDFGDRIYATPAIVEDTILVRTGSRLYAIGGE